MKLLIVSATKLEIAPLLAYLSNKDYENKVHYIITGVGMVTTTFQLTKHLLSHSYDLIIQLGVAGSYHIEEVLGTLYQVHSETFADLGAEDHDSFLDIFDLQLPTEENLYINKAIINPYLISDLKLAKGLTVNTCSGRQRTIDLRRNKYNADIESMEGAAFHYVATQLNCKYLQIRAISNHVIPRNRDTWNMKLAIENLNNFAIQWINTLYNSK